MDRRRIFPCPFTTPYRSRATPPALQAEQASAQGGDAASLGSFDSEASLLWLELSWYQRGNAYWYGRSRWLSGETDTHVPSSPTTPNQQMPSWNVAMEREHSSAHKTVAQSRLRYHPVPSPNVSVPKVQSTSITDPPTQRKQGVTRRTLSA
ncbi:hypothetical protein EJ06DRAFT_78150 [Trichodelitschia bisporula]|uniref:Uncharacterized protein n=1 Tax=Trichodelitschia bisporula TaxID=703511 RepID=A0A6G1HTC1_9PEZI|nr:hypothetical protein EJ06DRAFT_78150 [Trichodelitschia bisporula]